MTWTLAKEKHEHCSLHSRTSLPVQPHFPVSSLPPDIPSPAPVSYFHCLLFSRFLRILPVFSLSPCHYSSHSPTTPRSGLFPPTPFFTFSLSFSAIIQVKTFLPSGAGLPLTNNQGNPIHQLPFHRPSIPILSSSCLPISLRSRRTPVIAVH